MANHYNFYNLEASFKNYLVAGNKSASTVNNYLSDLRHFLGWFVQTIKTIRDLDDVKNPTELVSLINQESLADYIKYLEANNLPEKTVKRRMSTLRKFFTFSINQGWIPENILNTVDIKDLIMDPIEIILKKYKKVASDEDYSNTTEFFQIINSQ